MLNCYGVNWNSGILKTLQCIATWASHSRNKGSWSRLRQSTVSRWL